MTEECGESTDTNQILAAFICLFLYFFTFLLACRNTPRFLNNSQLLESDLKLHLKCIHKVVFGEKNTTAF